MARQVSKISVAVEGIQEKLQQLTKEYHKPQKLPVEKEKEMSEKLTNMSQNIGFSSNDNISTNEGISESFERIIEKIECSTKIVFYRPGFW